MSMLLKGDEPVPGYVLKKWLGKGQYGEVWQASAPGGAEAALKFINLAGRNGFKEFRGVMRIKGIRHAHLMPITALWMLDEEGLVLDERSFAEYESRSRGEKPNVRATLTVAAPVPSTLVVAMLLADKSLLDRIKEANRSGSRGIPLEDLLRYMEEAAKGIDYLNGHEHDLGEGPVTIQHCDVKPANIVLVGDSVLICDFGLARMLGENMSATATCPEGTPAYMAPEAFDRKPSHTTDQYSLAISYYELRTGELPFSESDLSSYSTVENAHKKGRLCLDRLPPPERAVIRKATSVRPSKRFPRSWDMVQALAMAAEQSDLASGARSVPGTDGLEANRRGDTDNGPVETTPAVDYRMESTRRQRSYRLSTPGGLRSSRSRKRRPRWLSVALVALLVLLACAATLLVVPQLIPDRLPLADRGESAADQAVARFRDNKDSTDNKESRDAGSTKTDSVPPPGQEPAKHEAKNDPEMPAPEQSIPGPETGIEKPTTLKPPVTPEAKSDALPAEASTRAAEQARELALLSRLEAGDPEEVRAAIREVEKLDPTQSPNLERIYQAMVDRAEKMPAIAPTAVAAIGKLRERSSPPARAPLDAFYERAKGLLRAGILRSISQRTAAARDLLNEAQELRELDPADPLASAFWAECRIAAISSNTEIDRQGWFSLTQIAEGLALQAGKETDQQVRDYLRYVAALIDFRSVTRRDSRLAADLIRPLVESQAALLEHPGRRSQAAEMLVDAAWKMPLPSDSQLLADFPLVEDAERVFGYLQAARMLQQPPLPDLRIGLVLANGQRQQPDGPATSRGAEELLADEGLRQAMTQRQVLGQVLWIHARSQQSLLESTRDERHRLQAIQAFAEILRRLRQVEPAAGLAVYERFVAGPLKMAESYGTDVANVPAEIREPLASLYAEQGSLILQDSAVEDLFREGAFATACESLRRANELAPCADYLVLQARALILVPGLNDRLGQLEALVGRGRELGAGHPGMQGLNGYVALLKSRDELDALKKSGLLDQAMSDLDQAAQAAAKAEDERQRVAPHFTSFLESLSTACVERATLSRNLTEKRDLLRRAEEAARKAVERTPRPRPENAYLALGHALEDIAKEAGFQERAAFDAAIEECRRGFEAAVHPLGRAKAVFAEGRARYRKASCDEFKLQAEDECDKAQKCLDLALETWKALPPNRESQADSAEAHIWKAKVCSLQGKRAEEKQDANRLAERLDEMDRQFQEGAELALGNRDPRWSTWQIEWSHFLQTSASLKLIDDARRQQSLDKARDAALAVLEKAADPTLRLNIPAYNFLLALSQVKRTTKDTAAVLDRVLTLYTHADSAILRDRVKVEKCGIMLSEARDDARYREVEPRIRADLRSILNTPVPEEKARDARSILASAHAMLGLMDARAFYSPATSREDKPQFKAAALANLEQAIQQFEADNDIANSVNARLGLAQLCLDLAEPNKQRGLAVLEPIRQEHAPQLWQSVTDTRRQLQSLPSPSAER